MRQRREEAATPDGGGGDGDDDDDDDRTRRQGRPKRDRPTVQYDEVTRRAAKRRRRAHDGYVDRGRAGGGTKRAAIAMGPAGLERATRGRYEWRDAAMRAPTGTRKRHWQELTGDG